MSNQINNHALAHRHVGLQSDGHGQKDVSIGEYAPQGLGDGDLFPMKTFLRKMRDLSPFAYRVGGEIDLPAPLNAAVSYPCVLFDPDKFGQKNYSPALHDRENKAWRMYVQLDSNKTIYFLESDDGVTWEDTPQQLSTSIFAASPAHAAEGIQVFYNKDGFVTISGVTYYFVCIQRIANLTTGDNTDLYFCYSVDGITWLRTQMADHGTSGAAVGNVVSSGLGTGAAYMEVVDPSAGTFAATQPRTFKNAPGMWWGLLREQDAPANAGDTVQGTVLVAQNSATEADYNKPGHFANWVRNGLAQVGERSFAHGTQMQIFHVVKVKDTYIALVQYLFQVAAGPTRVKSALGIAISVDGLHFEFCGPLYDAGFTHMYNDITSAVDATGMASTAWAKNQGNGTGAAILAGSLVVDRRGLNFLGHRDRFSEDRQFVRVYHVEQDNGKVIWGWI